MLVFKQNVSKTNILSSFNITNVSEDISESDISTNKEGLLVNNMSKLFLLRKKFSFAHNINQCKIVPTKSRVNELTLTFYVIFNVSIGGVCCIKQTYVAKYCINLTA